MLLGSLKKLMNKNSKKYIDNIGLLLPYSQYLIQVIVKQRPSQKFIKSAFMIANFDKFNTFFFMFKQGNRDERRLLERFLKQYEANIKEVRLIKKNDTEDFLEFIDICKVFNFPIRFGFRLVGNYAPQKLGKVLMFEDTAKLNYKDLNADLSFPQLAVMRLDVDNLGGVFEFGLSKRASLSRLATLSRELHLFFSGYINHLAKEFQLYITYSGGDDAFIISSWHNIMHFAQRLQNDFKEFTCANDYMSFSAGIFMCHENYPVARFAEDAAEAEEAAKKFEGSGELGKNAVSIFGHTLSWKSYDKQLKFAEDLMEFIEDENLPALANKGKLARSFIHRLLRIIKSAVREREGLENGKVKKKGSIISDKFYKNVAQLHYLFARHGYPSKKLEEAEANPTSQELSDKIANIVIKAILDDFSDKTKIKDYVVSMNYILLKTRVLPKK